METELERSDLSFASTIPFQQKKDLQIVNELKIEKPIKLIALKARVN